MWAGPYHSPEMHLGPQAPHPVPASPSSLPPAPPGGAASSPFSLAPGRDDTAVFKDARTGFSQLLPGRPTLGMPTQRSGEPPADAVVHLQDAPITVRYRIEPPSFVASSAADLARVIATQFATWRAQGQVFVDWANESWLAAWGVEAAAVAAYDIPENASTQGSPLTREDLFVLVRQGMAMLVSWTYPRGFIDDPAYATFASVAEATMVWDPARWEQRGRVWPDGPFLGPGLFGAPKPKYNEIARQLSQLPLALEERSQVLSLLAGIISSAGAPWVPLAADVVDGNKRALLSAVRSARLGVFIDEAFADVRTAHDLRGLAIVIGRAIDARRTSSIPPSLPGAASTLRPPPPVGLHY